MLLGQRLPGAHSGWRVVEGDLHDIAGRVREYDPDARLVREDGTGQLGLAVWQRKHAYIPGGAFAFAKRMFDPDTDLPLTHADGRVLRVQRGSDSRRFADLRVWHRMVAKAEAEREAREAAEIHESYGDHAERFVHALSKDVPAKPRAFIPRAA